MHMSVNMIVYVQWAADLSFHIMHKQSQLDFILPGDSNSARFCRCN